MQCLIAVDGLSSSDLTSLVQCLPRSGKLLERLRFAKINSSLSSTQAIWAELLTGFQAFLSGCAGYACPSSSLNKLVVCTERDLQMPARLVETDAGERSVTINLPLLLPRPENRTWLADGSLSTGKLVSPPQLRADPLFEHYLPRPYKSHAGATTLDQNDVSKQCIELESRRLSMAVSLFNQRNFSKFTYRLSVFDYLSHLIGTNFLAAKDLTVYKSLEKLLRQFDDALQVFSAGDFALVSAHSHTPCLGTINLNLLLASGGFLYIDTEEGSSRNRSERLKVASALWQPTTHHLTSLDGRLDTSRSVAASPVSGCVYINKRTVFDDGIVEDSDYLKVREAITSYLGSVLGSRFGRAFSLETYPHQLNSSSAPDLIVKIDGVEFNNLSESMTPVAPLTTHNPSGFALLPEGSLAADQISATDLATLLNA